MGIFIILLLGIIIYSNSFQCSFQFDDLYQIINNVKIRNLADFSTIWNSSPNRPVAFLSFAINYHFNQFDVRYWHLVNLAIHLINALLVWWLTLLIFSSPVIKDQKIATHKKLLAFATALLFVSHPLATQSVTYIVQRMTSLVALFYLFSLVLYVKARLSEKGMIVRILLFAGSFISAMLAMRTKENAFTLPFVLLLVEFFFIRIRKLSINFRDYRVILLILVFLGIILIIPLRYSLSIFKPIIPAGHPESALTPYYYFLTQLSVIVKYLQLLFLPVNLNLDYDFPVSTSFFQIRTLLSFLFLASLITVAVFLFKKQRIISFGIFWFFITLSVESSIIPINDVIVEHRTYLPSIGFFLVIIAALYFLFGDKYKWGAMGILFIMAGSCSYLAYERNKVWKDDLSLWNDVVSKSPGKPRAITNRGLAYANREQWDMAIEDYSRSLQIDPSFPITLISRGFAYKKLELFDKAIADYTKAIEIDPRYSTAYSNRGICYFTLGEREKAIDDFTRAIELDAGNADAYSDRSASFLQTGQLDKAIADINTAISLHPDNYTAISNRGAIYDKLNQTDKAIADYSRAIEINPDFVKGYVNRGSVYLKSGVSDKALADYSKAIEIDPKNTEAWFHRGVIYSNLGQRDKAIADYTHVIELDPDNALGYYNRGLNYGKMGKMELAIDDFTNALKIDPDFTAAVNNREVAYQKLKLQKPK
ncbi:MAG: tetratricopeptide repeat protein [Bacteroidetes bacterium]|nr:tetratricopeptide repeat protein [Bacteroidota bacterium]